MTLHFHLCKHLKYVVLNNYETVLFKISYQGLTAQSKMALLYTPVIEVVTYQRQYMFIQSDKLFPKNTLYNLYQYKCILNK
jgi:hypothetical protein